MSLARKAYWTPLIYIISVTSFVTKMERNYQEKSISKQLSVTFDFDEKVVQRRS